MRSLRSFSTWLVPPALLLLGCPVPLRTACPACVELRQDRAPLFREGVRRVYVVVPGILGYGWEWDGAQAAFSRDPAGQTLVVDWDPWQSLARGGARVRGAMSGLLSRLPPGVEGVTVLAHSAGGMVAVLAAAALVVPAGVTVQVIAIGTPFAGTHLDILTYEGSLHAPTPIAIGGTFPGWPTPARGVVLTVYPTRGAEDPVMRPRMGHDPADPRVLPPGTRVCALPEALYQGRDGHNTAVAWVAEQLVGAADFAGGGAPLAGSAQGVRSGEACVRVASLAGRLR